jgi:lipoate---protein ligase
LDEESSMPGAWRLLDHSFADPFMNLALEESILRGRVEGESPDTLRLWQHPRVVSLGCFQDPEEEINGDACKELGITVIKRLSPGGAMYLDKGSIQYSLTFDRHSLPLPEHVDDSYRLLSTGAVDALHAIGVKAEFRPINDLSVAGKKISGASQTRLYNAILHHGTISVNTRLQILERVLKPSELKQQVKRFQKFDETITTLSREIGRDVPIDAFSEQLVKGFARKLNLRFTVGGPTPWEMKTAEKLYQEKYRKLEWIYVEKKPHLDVSSSYKAAKGIIRISLSVGGERIEDLTISGDFILHPECAVEELEKGLRGELLVEETLRRKIQELFERQGIKAVGVSAEDFARALMAAYLGVRSASE